MTTEEASAKALHGFGEAIDRVAAQGDSDQKVAFQDKVPDANPGYLSRVWPWSGRSALVHTSDWVALNEQRV